MNLSAIKQTPMQIVEPTLHDIMNSINELKSSFIILQTSFVRLENKVNKLEASVINLQDSDVELKKSHNDLSNTLNEVVEAIHISFATFKKEVNQRFDRLEANMATKSQLEVLTDVLRTNGVISQFEARKVMKTQPVV